MVQTHKHTRAGVLNYWRYTERNGLSKLQYKQNQQNIVLISKTFSLSCVQISVTSRRAYQKMTYTLRQTIIVNTTRCNCLFHKSVLHIGNVKKQNRKFDVTNRMKRSQKENKWKGSKHYRAYLSSIIDTLMARIKHSQGTDVNNGV